MSRDEAFNAAQEAANRHKEAYIVWFDNEWMICRAAMAGRLLPSTRVEPHKSVPAAEPTARSPLRPFNGGGADVEIITFCPHCGAKLGIRIINQ